MSYQVGLLILTVTASGCKSTSGDESKPKEKV